MPITVELPRYLAVSLIPALERAIGRNADLAFMPGVAGTERGAEFLRDSQSLRCLSNDLKRSIARADTGIDSDDDAPTLSDCDPVTGQEYGTGA